MKKINSLWIWPPGAGGNFILKHYYGGDNLVNNEYVADIRWFPRYLNTSHADYFLNGKGEHPPLPFYERGKQEILQQENINYAWHFIPIHLIDYLDIKTTTLILPQPKDMWFIAFLTVIKNKSTDEYNEWAQDLLFPTSLEGITSEYNLQIKEFENFPSQEKYLIDYRNIFFDYKQETLDFLKLDKSIVQDYTEKNIALIKTFIKDKLNKEFHDVFLNKLVDLQA